MDVRHPLVFGCVGVPRADVPRLELLELLLGAEFVGLGLRGVSLVGGGRREEGEGGGGRRGEGEGRGGPFFFF